MLRKLGRDKAQTTHIAVRLLFHRAPRNRAVCKVTDSLSANQVIGNERGPEPDWRWPKRSRVARIDACLFGGSRHKLINRYYPLFALTAAYLVPPIDGPKPMEYLCSHVGYQGDPDDGSALA